MTEYALLQGDGPARRIVTVVTTARTGQEVRERHPEFEVAPLDSLSESLKRSYRYWGERP